MANITSRAASTLFFLFASDIYDINFSPNISNATGRTGKTLVWQRNITRIISEKTARHYCINRWSVNDLKSKYIYTISKQKLCCAVIQLSLFSSSAWIWVRVSVVMMGRGSSSTQSSSGSSTGIGPDPNPLDGDPSSFSYSSVCW